MTKSRTACDWRSPLSLLCSAASAAARRRRRPQEPAVVVEVAKAEVARVAPRRWVPGGVVSRNDARLATSAAGRLDYVAEVGTRVRAGERVAKLEDEAVRLRVDDAKAEVARIEAQRAMSERQLQRLEKARATTRSRRRSSTKSDRNWPC